MLKFFLMMGIHYWLRMARTLFLLEESDNKIMSDDDKFCDNNKHIWQNKKCWAHFDEFVRKGLSEKVVFELKLKWQENIKEFPCKYFRLKKKRRKERGYREHRCSKHPEFFVEFTMPGTWTESARLRALWRFFILRRRKPVLSTPHYQFQKEINVKQNKTKGKFIWLPLKRLKT